MDIGVFQGFLISIRNQSRLYTPFEDYAPQCNLLAHKNKVPPSHSVKSQGLRIHCISLENKWQKYTPLPLNILDFRPRMS